MSVKPAIEESKKNNKGRNLLIAIIVIFVLGWILIRPGVFTIQPIGALPNGVTFIYHSRSSEMPFFSSPDGLCLRIQGSVSLLCRGTVIGASTDLLDRVLIKFPYSHWAYLQSTDGKEFDR